MKRKLILTLAGCALALFFGSRFLHSNPGQNDIIIGTTMGLTGNISPEAQSVKKGIELRLKKENNAGGINGKKIRWIVLDDGYKPERALKNAKTLVDKHGVDIILFPVGSATTKAFLPMVQEKKVVVLFTSSGSPALRTPTPEYFIHMRPSYPDMSYALVSYAKNNRGAKRFAIISQADITAEGITETMKKVGIPKSDYMVVSHRRNVIDMSKQAEEIRKFKPDALLLWTTSAASKELIKQIGAENLINTVMLGADMANPTFNQFLKGMGLEKNYIDSQALPNPETSQWPIMQEIRTALADYPIDGLLAEGYIATDNLIHLLKQIGGNTDKEKIIKAAEQIKNLNLRGVKLNFDPKDRKLSPLIWLTTGQEWTPIDVSKK